MVISDMIRQAENQPSWFQKFLMLFIIGLSIIFVGIIILIVATVLYGSGSINFGTVIFIGPFPIVVGAGSEATWIVLFAIILAAISIIMFLIMHKELKKANT